MGNHVIRNQGFVEHVSQDVENMLDMDETNVWAMKNRAYHEDIECLPYETLFGCPMKMAYEY